MFLIYSSEIRYFSGNLGVAWIQCPMRAALRIKEAGDSITVGWSKIKVEVLKPRPLQCFKCLARAHYSKVP